MILKSFSIVIAAVQQQAVAKQTSSLNRSTLSRMGSSLSANLIFVEIRAAITEEKKFLTVSLATFRDNKQGPYGIFSMFLQLPIHRKTANSGKIIPDSGCSQICKS